MIDWFILVILAGWCSCCLCPPIVSRSFSIIRMASRWWWCTKKNIIRFRLASITSKRAKKNNGLFLVLRSTCLLGVSSLHILRVYTNELVASVACYLCGNTSKGCFNIKKDRDVLTKALHVLVNTTTPFLLEYYWRRIPVRFFLCISTATTVSWRIEMSWLFCSSKVSMIEFRQRRCLRGVVRLDILVLAVATIDTLRHSYTLTTHMNAFSTEPKVSRMSEKWPTRMVFSFCDWSNRFENHLTSNIAKPFKLPSKCRSWSAFKVWHFMPRIVKCENDVVNCDGYVSGGGK